MLWFLGFIKQCFSCGDSEVYDAMHTENDRDSRLLFSFG